MIPQTVLKKQIAHCLKGTNFQSLGQKYEGKVRDNYIQNKRRILIASDRLSAFDRVITLIPFKGQLLTQMAKFWFENTKDIVKNHVIGYPDPNVLVAVQCEPLPVEMVVRGYLTGVTTTSAWYHYEKGVRNFCGNQLPDGMKKDQKFEKPIITPSTKAKKGEHDESVSPQQIYERNLLTEDQWKNLSEIALKLFERGRKIAAKQGIILVDTKYEFGTLNGELVLMDEIHTPDSSRFWFADEYEKRFEQGETQKQIDKEYLREWLKDHGFTGDGEMPIIPDDVRVEAARRYIEAFELITGQTFQAELGNPLPRIEKNIQNFLKIC